jgi:hypothetical protein
MNRLFGRVIGLNGHKIANRVFGSNCACGGIGEAALPDSSSYVETFDRVQARERWARYEIDSAIPRAQEHHAHGALYGALAGAF